MPNNLYTDRWQALHNTVRKASAQKHTVEADSRKQKQQLLTYVRIGLWTRGYRGRVDTHILLQHHFPDKESKKSYNITTLCTISTLSGAQYLVFAWAHPFRSCQSW